MLKNDKLVVEGNLMISTIKTEEEPSQEEATAASSEEKPDAESPLTEVKPKD